MSDLLRSDTEAFFRIGLSSLLLLEVLSSSCFFANRVGGRTSKIPLKRYI